MHMVNIHMANTELVNIHTCSFSSTYTSCMYHTHQKNMTYIQHALSHSRKTHTFTQETLPLLLDAACHRLTAVLRHCFDIVLQQQPLPQPQYGLGMDRRCELGFIIIISPNTHVFPMHIHSQWHTGPRCLTTPTVPMNSSSSMMQQAPLGIVWRFMLR